VFVKGIAHFATGVAVATFFPEVVTGAAHSLAFGPVLAGIAGLLPDTLDFRFVRYFERVDEEVDPGQAVPPDPQAIAERIAGAMDRAYETGKRVKIRVHSVRLGADLWRQMFLTFDVTRNEVAVRFGPIVTTGQVPLAGSEIPSLGPGRAAVTARMLHTYDEDVAIDIFSGPSLAFDREDGAVRVTFLPWHRAWTHSALVALLAGAAGLMISPVAGLVIFLGVLSHIFVDQMGFMGSNIFFPLTRRRTMGWKLFRSGDALPNFLCVWVSLALILLNLDRFSETPFLPPLPYLVVVILLPCLLFLGLRIWSALQRLRGANARRQATPAALAAIEALDEAAEADF
jgi:hypothetical protein